MASQKGEQSDSTPLERTKSSPIPMSRWPRSHFLFFDTSRVFNKFGLRHPQKNFTRRLTAIDKGPPPPSTSAASAPVLASNSERRPQTITLDLKDPSSRNMSTNASAPGEQFEVRQTATDEDYKPDPSKSLPLNPARQALIDDIIALYSCQPTVERVKRYSPDCVYDDQFVYANDRYKMAGQWFALPKLFNASKNEGYQIIKNDRDLIQFKNEQSWTFRVIPKTATINALVSLSLDPATVDSDFIQVKYHKDQANDKDYSHEGLGFSFKKWQADQVAKHMDAPEVKEFEADRTAAKEPVKKYGSGTEKGDAPKKDFTQT